MTICQLQNITKSFLILSFSALFLNSCSSVPLSTATRDQKVIIAQWNKLPLRFAPRDDNDGIVVNPFFDIDPLIANFREKDPDNFGVRYFVTTPVDSKFQYNFDVYSGKLYRERELCAQDDIWKNYSADIVSPNYTQGIVPRTFDGNGDPMRIMIISNKENIEPFRENPTHWDEARIVGSVVVDHCENFPCDLPGKWKMSQILVGVSTRDSSYNYTDSFASLKKRIDWDYARAYLTNLYGYHKLANKIYPAYRISKELNLKDSVEFFKKTGKTISSAELKETNTWRSGCMKLYDTIWETSENARKLSYDQGNTFLRFFRKFYAKDSDLFSQCLQKVRPANIVEDHRRLWFFAYLQAFAILEKNDFYYNCHDNSWAYNPRIDENHLYIDQNKELDKCLAKNYESMFDQAINGMSLLKNQTNRAFRFIEYDNGRGGSHQKIYSWIQGKGHQTICKYDKEQKVAPYDVFPQDVVWENYKPDDAGLVK